MSKELYVLPRYTEWALHGGVKTKEALRRVYLQRRRDLADDHSGKGVFRGSLIGHPCDRQQAISFLGARSDDDRDLRFANAGKQRHYEWQEIGLSAGFLVEIEKKVRNGKFRGTIDGLLDNGWVFELKTANDFSFKPTAARRAAGASGPIDRPNTDHYMQVQMYMHALGSPRAVLLYEARNSLELAEHVIDYSPEVAERQMQRIATIYGLTRIGELPNMHQACTDRSKMREHCNFSEPCIDAWVKQRIDAL